MIRYLLDGATLNTCLNSLAPHRQQFKIGRYFCHTLYTLIRKYIFDYIINHLSSHT